MKVVLKEIRCFDEDCTHLTHDRVLWLALINTVLKMAPFWVIAPCGLVEVD
jgi:hypothetical protein